MPVRYLKKDGCRRSYQLAVISYQMEVRVKLKAVSWLVVSWLVVSLLVVSWFNSHGII